MKKQKCDVHCRFGSANCPIDSFVTYALNLLFNYYYDSVLAYSGIRGGALPVERGGDMRGNNRERRKQMALTFDFSPKLGGQCSTDIHSIFTFFFLLKRNLLWSEDMWN